MKTRLRWIFLACCLLGGGFMFVDGMRALAIGDYFTPSKGAYAGQLGPWANLVSAVGLPPRSLLMKIVFVIYGSATVLAATLYCLGLGRLRLAMIILLVSGLWYIPFGSMLFLAALILIVIDTRESRGIRVREGRAS